jgi:hypothetical protein
VARVLSWRAARIDGALMTKYIALLVAATALAGCCLSSNGCYVPLAREPSIGNGLGAASIDEAEPSKDTPRPKERPKKKVIIESGRELAGAKLKPEGKDIYLQQETADRAAEEKLTKKLMICSDCLPRQTNKDAGSSAR